jgi:hypothetical protein
MSRAIRRHPSGGVNGTHLGRRRAGAAKVSISGASVGTAVVSVGRWLRDRRGQGEEEARPKEGV